MMLQMVHDHTAHEREHSGFQRPLYWDVERNGKKYHIITVPGQRLPRNTDKSKMPPLETQQKQI